MADDLEIGKWIHDELLMSNAGYWFFAEPSNAGHLLLALHINNSGEIAAVSVSFDPNQLGDVDGLSIVYAFLVDMPYSY